MATDTPATGLNRRALLALGGAAALAATARPVLAQDMKAAGDPDETMRLWPGNPPGAPSTLPKEEVVTRNPASTVPDRAVSRIGTPMMTVFRPARPNGAALLIIPGGGYVRVVIDKEGFECARRWSEKGVTCFVMRYRLPADGWADRARAPLQDAQRAMRLIRASAAKYGIDPNRINVLGFSAGGHLAASLATRHAEETYAPVDAADRLSARPTVAALGYPVISMSAPHAHMGSRAQLIGENAAPEVEAINAPSNRVTAETPPTFLFHATDDRSVPVNNSLMMYAGLVAKNIPTEMHLFEKGGHGFGLRDAAGIPAEAWPQLFDRWAATHGWL
ncbi:alpha/beta hydrolase [Pedomonas mirosovicensis]|uniref:alpha/beta hydrolase n=1 Tax=Pedomonas mirosovicensis TaxID=2908641 RepID=UPI00216A5FE9|nr:alpha/beta hydrolase [Pedomonas mirosovicensis]MCH8686277.1 alpha/beta hydrolase [Pedomonas mirosovicensis]